MPSGSPKPEPALKELGPFRLSIPTHFGPRILGLRFEGGPEIFASLSDDIGLETPGLGFLRFRGGHRLWAAPEVPAVTYAPDDEPCQVAVGENSVTVTGAVDAAGLRKQINVSGDGSELAVDHLITNEGDESVEVAPWAITQFRLGGTAVLPLGESSPGSLQADRSLVLWPYSSLTDSRLEFIEGAVVVAARAGPPLKIGAGPDPGHLEYTMGGVVFRKRITSAIHGRGYPDRGAVGQIYVCPDFCELESLGALSDLEPGQSVEHHEVWSIGVPGSA